MEDLNFDIKEGTLTLTANAHCDTECDEIPENVVVSLKVQTVQSKLGKPNND